QRQVLVVERGQVEVGDRTHALAARAHATEHGVRGLLRLRLAGSALDGDRTTRPHRWDVERERVRRPDVRLAIRLNRMRSIALASVTVPTVERGLAPIRS